MTRIDTLPTLPGGDELVDGWMFDTEPGTPPPDAPPGCESLLTISVGEIARYRARCVPPKASLDEITTAVLAADGEPVIVLDSGRPLGVIRPPELIRALVASGQGERRSAATLMSSALLCLRHDAPASRALELMTERGAQQVAVIDGAGSLAGIVTPADVVRALTGRVGRGSAA